MEGANLRRSRIIGANFNRARMEGTNLTRARMEGANLGRASLERAYLGRARLEIANLGRAKIESVASFGATSLNGAALKLVVLPANQLSKKLVRSCFGDASVILPERITPPPHWPDWTLPGSGDHAFDTELRKWQANPDAYTPPKKPG